MTDYEKLQQSLQGASLGTQPETSETALSTTPLAFNRATIPQQQRRENVRPTSVVIQPTPFQILPATTASTTVVKVKVYKYSFLRLDVGVPDGLSIDGLDEDIAIVAGDQIWLQVDTDDGVNANAASIEHGSSPPYIGNGPSGSNQLVNIAGMGTADDPYLWDQSFVPIAQVFASDGTLLHNGRLFVAGTTKLEVVSFVSTNLALTSILTAGCFAKRAVADSAPIIPV